MSTYFGSDASETLNFGNWDNNWTSFFMSGGNDSVNTARSGVAYYFDGGSGNDFFYGYDKNDTAHGGSGDDILQGFSGNDRLLGDAGRDVLRGGDGNDDLWGGMGRDGLTGGEGVDKFHFVKGQSNATTSGADVIYDWDVAHDWIDSSVAGTFDNFGKAATHATNVEAALLQAEAGSLTNKTHVFLYNASADKGFLLSDLDHNGHFETAIVIKGAGSSGDMHWSDII